MSDPPNTTPIYRLLSQGASRAVGRRYLANLTGLRERDLRRLIERERRAGIPILYIR